MVQFRDKMENKSYKLHKLLAYFSVLRNLIWLGAMTLVTSEFHNTIKENRYHRSFSIGFQFFALFSVYGTVKLVQGFNYVTKKRELIPRYDYLFSCNFSYTGNSQSNDLLPVGYIYILDFQFGNDVIWRLSIDGRTKQHGQK